MKERRAEWRESCGRRQKPAARATFRFRDWQGEPGR